MKRSDIDFDISESISEEDLRLNLERAEEFINNIEDRVNSILGTLNKNDMSPNFEVKNVLSHIVDDFFDVVEELEELSRDLY